MLLLALFVNDISRPSRCIAATTKERLMALVEFYLIICHYFDLIEQQGIYYLFIIN